MSEDETYPALPDWATYRGENPQGMPIVDIDAHEMYPALLQEYADHYAENGAGNPGEGDFSDPEEPTAYALEVCYQTAKMDVWIALGDHVCEIRIHDSDKIFAQSDHPDGRGPKQATPETAEPGARRESVDHYRRLRGVVPGIVRA